MRLKIYRSGLLLLIIGLCFGYRQPGNHAVACSPGKPGKHPNILFILPGDQFSSIYTGHEGLGGFLRPG